MANPELLLQILEENIQRNVIEEEEIKNRNNICRQILQHS